MTLICGWCGREFTRPNAHGPIPRFCKGSCRQRAHEARHSVTFLVLDRDMEAVPFTIAVVDSLWSAFSVAQTEVARHYDEDEDGPLDWQLTSFDMRRWSREWGWAWLHGVERRGLALDARTAGLKFLYASFVVAKMGR